MTRQDILRLQRWLDDHHTYSGCLLAAGLLFLFGSLISIDTFIDGGSCVNKYNYTLDACNPGGKHVDVVPLVIFTIIPYVAAFILTASLPFNTLILKLRRTTFHGDKIPSRRELKVKERERQAEVAILAIRQRERELKLEPYEFGSLSRQGK